MKKVLKKLPLIVLALVLVLAIKDKTYAATYGDLTYKVQDDGTIQITDCDTSVSGKLTIPDTIEGKKVMSIGNDAFYGCRSLTNITIPNSVTSIGNDAFYECFSLTNITIPNSVTRIGDYAFYGCYSLTNITIPNSVTRIGNYAFRYCNSLTNITIPDSVTSIGYNAFNNCSSLININVEKENSSYSSIDGILFNKTQTVIIKYPGEKKGTSYEIPNGVTSIGNDAFWRCSSLTNITIPNSVTSIGNDAFLGCSSLTNITIPNSVTSIGDWAFLGCSSLSKVLCLGNAALLEDDVFSDTPSDLKIYAKNGLTEYDANGWENYSNNIVRYEEGLKDSNVTFTSASQKAKIELADDSFKEIASIKSYENYNKNVISIDSDGNITTLKNGTTNIEVKVQYFNGTEIILNEKVVVDIKPQVVGLDKTSYTFNDTKNMQLKATILPTQASNTKLNWTSDNKSVATVDGNGVVTPVKNGTCNITATTADGTNIKGNCNITVDIKPQVVGLDKTSYTFNDTKNMQLKATILPNQASNTKLNWTSDNKSVATVDGNGVVTPVKNGTCNITATTADGTNIKGNCNITVDFKVTSISFSTTSYTITSVNQTPSFRAIIIPSNAANKSVKWTSSDENVAKVSTNGVIKPVKNGTCKIIATTTDGTNLSASIDITVDIKATKITLDKTNINLTNEKYSDKITAKIEPSEASDKVKYTSSNEKVAKVKEDGTVIAVGKGNCIITATTTDGTNLSAKCNVISEVEYQKGDVNKDGIVDVADVIYAMNKLSKGTLTDEEKIIGNVNDDSIFDVADVIKIMRYLSGKISSL